MVNIKRLATYLIIGYLLVFLALIAFPVNILDIRQMEGMPFPRAVPSSGKPFGPHLIKNRVVAQSFRPIAANISGFSIFFNKIGHKQVDGLITFSLKVITNNKVKTLYTIRKKATDISQNTHTTFYFQPIQIEKGGVYLIELSATAKNRGLSPYRSYKDPYKRGMAYLNEQPTKHDIVFQTYYQSNLLGFFKQGTTLNIFLLSLIFLAITLGLMSIAIIDSLLTNKNGRAG